MLIELYISRVDISVGGDPSRDTNDDEYTTDDQESSECEYMEHAKYEEPCCEDRQTHRELSTDTDSENYAIPTSYPLEYAISDGSPEECEEYGIDKEWENMPKEYNTRCPPGTKKRWSNCLLHRGVRYRDDEEMEEGKSRYMPKWKLYSSLTRHLRDHLVDEIDESQPSKISTISSRWLDMIDLGEVGRIVCHYNIDDPRYKSEWCKEELEHDEKKDNN